MAYSGFQSVSKYILNPNQQLWPRTLTISWANDKRSSEADEGEKWNLNSVADTSPSAPSAGVTPMPGHTLGTCQGSPAGHQYRACKGGWKEFLKTESRAGLEALAR